MSRTALIHLSDKEASWLRLRLTSFRERLPTERGTRYFLYQLRKELGNKLDLPGHMTSLEMPDENSLRVEYTPFDFEEDEKRCPHCGGDLSGPNTL